MIRAVIARAVAAVATRRDSYIRALRPAPSLADTFEAWLVAMASSLDPDTVRTYRVTYVRVHWMPFFKTMGGVTDTAKLADYSRARLACVLKKTVQKEVSALRGFLVWCHEQRRIDDVPEFPALPRKATGVRSGKQRAKAPEHSEEQIRAAIAAMPERSRKGGFIVRARHVVAYETGLRPATLDILVPAVLDLERKELTISDEEDKARFGRVVPLTDLAVEALRPLCAGAPPNVPIFGKHDYRGHLRKAARAAGMKSLSPYDFRHACVTHLLEKGASIPGVGWMVGHKLPTTTNRYCHTPKRSAEQALAVTGGRVSEQRASVVDQVVAAPEAERRTA